MMQEDLQQTISKNISFEGIGLHSGKNSKIRLLPCNDDQGIIPKMFKQDLDYCPDCIQNAEDQFYQ